MYTAKHITVDHKDLIHDVSYDFYGKRMATCSSDQSVKVRWDHIESQNFANRILGVLNSTGVIFLPLNPFLKFNSQRITVRQGHWVHLMNAWTFTCTCTFPLEILFYYFSSLCYTKGGSMCYSQVFSFRISKSLL